jgi:hypothetical protein
MPEKRVVADIPLDVLRDLGGPVRPVPACPHPVIWTAVPGTTVKKGSDPLGRKDNVRLAAQADQRAAVLAKSKATPM